MNVNWKETIFDPSVWDRVYNTNKDVKKAIMYFVSIILYIISFHHLFDKNNSVYFIYVFVFILSSLFPFTWIEDFNNIFDGNTIIIYAGLFLQFLALFFVILKNENVRKMNKKNGESGLETSSKTTNKNDNTIKILLVTITTLIWSIVGGAFSNFSDETQTSTLPKVIKWLIQQPKKIIDNLDIFVLYYMRELPFNPLMKAFSIYCITFIVLFFGAFVRIPRDAKERKPMDRFRIINMTPMFPPIFNRNINDYRNTGIFFLCVLLTLALSQIMWFIKTLTSMPSVLMIASTLVGMVLFLGCLFGKRYEAFPDVLSVKKLLFFLVSIVFGAVGTPIVLAIFQIFADIGLLNVNTINFQAFGFGNFLHILSTVIFIVLTFVAYGLGANKWLDGESRKPLEMFTVVLVCMTLSLFMALYSKHRMGGLVYNFLNNIISFVVKYLAPIGVLILSIVQFHYSYKNHLKYKSYSKRII